MYHVQGLYHQLDRSKPHIRLVQIRRELGHETRCHIEAFSLENIPEYVALSYTWGQPDETHEIVLNGSRFAVRSNLYEYLQVLKDERDFSWHYIDAVCINQQDIAEKEMQIALMGEIFGKAKEVVVWLGIGFVRQLPASFITFALGECPMTPQNQVLSAVSAFDKTVIPRLAQVCESEVNISNAFDETPALAFYLIIALIPLEYWSRLWIVQEVILARKLTLRCRKLRLEEDMLECFMRHAYPVGDDYTDDHPLLQSLYEHTEDYGINNALRRAQSLLAQRRTLQNYQGVRPQLPLFRAIGKTAGQECSVVQDKVFGLLGLARSNIKVNYSMPITELYVRALIEGLIEMEQARQQDEQPDGNPQPFIRFCYTLLQSIGLSPVHPTIALATIEVCRLCQVILDVTPFWIYCLLLSYSRRISRFDQSPGSFKHKHNLKIARGKCTLVMLRLNVYRLQNRQLSDPKASDRPPARQSYRQWVTLVEDVYLDFQGKSSVQMEAGADNTNNLELPP